ncbi:MAG: hypothetical protein U0X75_17670 [Acidobacteriota bacterium]
MYLASPEYVAKYQAPDQFRRQIHRQLLRYHAEHIKLVVDAVRALSPGRRTISSVHVEEQATKVDPVPLAERSRFANKIANGEFVTGVEIVPPKVDASS